MGGGGNRSDKPTGAPPFDPGAFARESESKLAAASAPDSRSFARFGTRASVPWLTISFEELRTLPLDHRAGFIVSLVDGTSSVEMILDVCGISKKIERVRTRSFIDRARALA
jgi:hypothetical protein